jgi:hypothetical protein
MPSLRVRTQERERARTGMVLVLVWVYRIFGKNCSGVRPYVCHSQLFQGCPGGMMLDEGELRYQSMDVREDLPTELGAYGPGEVTQP